VGSLEGGYFFSILAEGASWLVVRDLNLDLWFEDDDTPLARRAVSGSARRGGHFLDSTPVPSPSPLDQLDDNKVIAIARVEQEKPIRGRGLELEEEVHGGVGLECGKCQVAAAALESDRIGYDGTKAKASIELTIGDVAILALVHVGLAVEYQPTQVPYEVGGDHGDESPFRHDAGLNVVELQPCMGSCHLSCSGQETQMREVALEHRSQNHFWGWASGFWEHSLHKKPHVSDIRRATLGQY
jgi:hypothetical protein